MVKLTHLDKLYWPDDKITKGDLIEYYTKVSPYILPYLKDRPFVMRRSPDGIKKASFFQKEAGSNLPKFVKTAPIVHDKKTVNYILVQNAETLLYVANLGCIEMHAFLSTIKHIEKPDYILIDLDPLAISFQAVIETAQVIHDILAKIEVPHYCKTSGMTGLHICIPLHAKYEYATARRFADVIAHIAHQSLPAITSLERSPRKRQKKVYIDTLQNLKGQTMPPPYSARSAPHAPVSTPLLWSEVKAGLDPTAFSLKTILKRLSQKGDLFTPVLKKGIDINKSINKIEKLNFI